MGLRKKRQEIHQDRIYLGKIIKPHGLRGEVKFRPFGIDPWMLEEFSPVHLESPDMELDVEYVRGTDKAPIVKFKSIDDRNASESLINGIVWIHQSLLPELDEDSYYESDILYARVITVHGDELGQVQEIIETGECDVLVVRNREGKECMLPANREVIKEIRKAESTLIVEPLIYEKTDDED